MTATGYDQALERFRIIRPFLEEGIALANRGYELRVIQDYLGHRDPKHTTRYTRTSAHRFEGLWE